MIIRSLGLLVLLAMPVQADPIRPFVVGSMQEIRNDLAGAPGIVSFWSVDCPPCLRELTMFTELKRRQPHLQLVLVSADDQSLAEEVRGVLQETGADVLPSWQFADPFVQKLRYEVDSRWQGGLPRNYLLSPSGEMLAVSGVVSREQIENWLHQYTKK